MNFLQKLINWQFLLEEVAYFQCGTMQNVFQFFFIV